MTCRLLLPVTGWLLTAAALLQVSTPAASGAVVSGVSAVRVPVNRNPTVSSGELSVDPAWQVMAAAASQNSFAGGNPNPGVHPPNSNPYGLSYSEWSAQWWQWLLRIPAATNPNLDSTGANCAQGQSGHVWFLAGSFGTLPSPISRDCKIPNGTSILLPVLNQADGAALLDCAGPPPYDVPCADFTFNGKTGLAALREEAKVSQDNPALLQLTLDNVPITGLPAYRVTSPVFSFSLTTGNVITYLLAAFNIGGTQPPGTYTPAVSDGYWVMFTPLSPGTHTIHFEGVQSGGFATGGITYHLTVGK